MTTDYHHGDLPTALRAAAVDLIAEVGPSNFSLREVARRAGVSHAAPAHHFGDKKGLLTSIAAEGFATLTNAMVEARDSGDPARERLNGIGHAYLKTALENPGHYAVMITHEHTHTDDEHLTRASVAAFTTLHDVIQDMVAEYDSNVSVDDTSVLMWATVHGLVELAPVLGDVAESTSTKATSLDNLLETLTDTVVTGLAAQSRKRP